MKNKLLYLSSEKTTKQFMFSQDKYTNNVLDFLDHYISKRIEEDITFDYYNKICLYNKKSDIKKVILGKSLKLDFKENTITISKRKTYLPYYNEIETVGIYNFNDVGFNNPIDLLVIKFLKYIEKTDKTWKGVHDFPKFIIANSTSNKICKEFNIDKQLYTYEKYEEIVQKYIAILLDFYNILKTSNCKLN